MKAQEIQDLISFIANSGLDQVNIETEDFKLEVRKSAKAPATSAGITPAMLQQLTSAAGGHQQQTPASQPAQQAAPAPEQSESTSDSSKSESGKELVTIKSPMIGTFYRSANPESPVFVNVGDEVKSGEPVCIIEAMKLFNEIESEVSGKIVKVLVDNAQPVEYDQPLFLVEPA